MGLLKRGIFIDVWLDQIRSSIACLLEGKIEDSLSIKIRASCTVRTYVISNQVWDQIKEDFNNE